MLKKLLKKNNNNIEENENEPSEFEETIETLNPYQPPVKGLKVWVAGALSKFTWLERRLVRLRGKIRIVSPLFVGILIVLLPLLFLKIQKGVLGTAEAAWWNDDWLYRQSVVVTYTGSETLTEYQVLVDDLDTATMITDGKLNDDCSDLRFVSVSGKVLDHWLIDTIDDGCDASETDIWVKTDLIPADDTMFYMYYGNPTAQTKSSQIDTFTYTAEKDVAYILHSLPNQLEVISMTDNNVISHNGTTLNLDRNDVSSFSTLSQFGVVSARANFAADDASDNTDMLVPMSWAGTDFYVRSRDSGQNFYIWAIAPWGNATATLYSSGTAVTGCTSFTISTTGTSQTCASVGNGSIRLNTDVPVLAFIQPTNSDDQMPWHPVNDGDYRVIGSLGRRSRISNGPSSNDIRYQSADQASEQNPADIAADAYTSLLESGTYGSTGVIYRSTNSSTWWVNQEADGDGSDGHIFVDESEMATHYAAATGNTDYIAVAATSAISCTVYNASTDAVIGGPTTAVSANTTIYDLGFGTGNSTTWTSADWYMECDGPGAAFYQKGGNSESNIWRITHMRQYTYPAPSAAAPTSEEKTPGPVGYWRFDEGHGAVANDTSTADNNGTITGATWQTGDLCLAHSCLAFDGTDDYVAISDDGTLDFDGSGSFTVQAWVRRGPMSSGTLTIISKYETTGGDGGFELYMDGSGDLNFGIDDDNSSFPEDEAGSTTENYDDNQWHLVTGVKNGVSSIQLYVDGQLIATDSSLSANGVIDNGDTLYIGSRAAGTNDFDGFIDEVKVYPYARSAAQVQSDYFRYAARHGSGVVLGIDDGDYLNQGLGLYYNLEDDDIDSHSCDTGGSVAGACNSAGGEYHGVANGTMTDGDYTVGKFGSDIAFDGGDDFLDTNAASTEFLSAGTGTISMWINPTGSAPAVANAYSGEGFIGDTGGYYGIYRANISSTDRLWVYNWDGDEDRIGITYNADEWVHVTWVHKDGYLSAYKNGEFVGAVASGDTQVMTGDLTMGFAYTSGDYANGAVDEVRVYNRALSNNEVRALYNWAPGPLGYWPMNENQGITAIEDLSGNDNAATLNSITATQWEPGKIGSAINFAGSPDRADASDTGFPDNAEPRSFSAWINTTSSVDKAIVSYGTATNDDHSHLSIPASGVVRVGFWNNDVDGTTTVDDGEWHHVAGTFDGGTGVHIYVDGVLDATGTVTTPTTALNGTLAIAMNAGSSEYFDGLIDEVKVYDYELTPRQIVQDMNGGESFAASTSSRGTLLHLRMEEGFSNVTFDASGNDRNGGLINNASWASSGRFGKAIDLDGASDYVQVSGTLGDPEDVTIMGWVDLDNPDTSGAELISIGDYVAITVDDPTNGTLGFFYDGSSEDQTTSSIDYDGSGWTHLAYVVDITNGTQTLYANGQSIGTSTHTNAISYSGRGTNTIIGAHGNSGSANDLDGRVDEIKVYSAALTKADIALEYSQSKSIYIGSSGTDSSGYGDNASNRTYCAPGDSTASCEPVGEWLLDENAGTVTAYDTSDNSNDGTLTSIVDADWGVGHQGSALILDGAADFVDIGGGPGTVNSIEFWVYPETTTEYFINLTSTTDYIWLNAGTLTATGMTSPTYYVNGVQTQTMVADEWQHVVVTSATSENASNLDIGRTQNTNYLEGMIDEVVLYDYELSERQVGWRHNKGAPYAHWRFDECLGDAIYDSSGRGLHGIISAETLENTATGYCDSGTSTEMWNNGTNGKYNSALDFDGSDDYGYVQGPGLPTGDFTYTLWVQLDRTSDEILVMAADGSGGNEFFLRVLNGDFEMFTNNSQSATTTNEPIDEGVWYHLAATREGTASNNLTLYINGIQVDQGTDAVALGFSTCELLIGVDADATCNGTLTNHTDGRIDDLKIWHYALNQTQIYTEYNDGTVRFN